MKSPLKYHGGKSYLASRIFAKFMRDRLEAVTGWYESESGLLVIKHWETR